MIAARVLPREDTNGNLAENGGTTMRLLLYGAAIVTGAAVSLGGVAYWILSVQLPMLASIIKPIM